MQVSEPIERIERDGVAMPQQMMDAGHPVCALALDQVTDNGARTPSLRAFVTVEPPFGQTAQPFGQHGGSALQDTGSAEYVGLVHVDDRTSGRPRDGSGAPAVRSAPGSVLGRDRAEYDRGVITRIADVKPLIAAGRRDPAGAFPRIEKFARSDEWQTREVAATIMVEIAKVHPAEVLRQARIWARDTDPNVRRTASEGLRGLVKKDPQGVLAVIETLRADHVLYVKKSVANVLRNASVAQPEFVIKTCRAWAKSPSEHTRWIVKDGLRKLSRLQPERVAPLLRMLG